MYSKRKIGHEEADRRQDQVPSREAPRRFQCKKRCPQVHLLRVPLQPGGRHHRPEEGRGDRARGRDPAHCRQHERHAVRLFFRSLPYGKVFRPVGTILLDGSETCDFAVELLGGPH